MELVETLFSLVRYLGIGLVAGFALLVALAVAFGKRVEKRFDLEADFRDERGREIGEFEIEERRVLDPEDGAPKEFTLRAKFELRHPALAMGARVAVRLEDELAFDATVETPGRIRLREDQLLCKFDAPEAGQMVTVEVAGAELLAAPLRHD